MLPYENYKDLLDRKYQAGTDDCYGLVREVYKRTFGIDLPNYARPEDFEFSTLELVSRIVSNPDFIKKNLNPNALVVGDVLGFRVAAPRTDHFGIYIGNNLFLHHMRGRKPVEDNLDQRWVRRITHVLSHVDVTPVKEQLSAMDFLPPHLKELYNAAK